MADREYFFGDPAFVDVPVDHLLDPATIARRAAAVRDDQAFGQMPAPCLIGRILLRIVGARVAEDGGRHLHIAARWTAGATRSAQRRRTAPATCPWCRGWASPSGRGSQSRPDPRHPAWRGARQAATADAQSGDGALTRDGGVMPFGTPGGDVQTQAMLQVILNILHFGMEVQDAIEAPRVARFLVPIVLRAVRVFPWKAGDRGSDRSRDTGRAGLARSRR